MKIFIFLKNKLIRQNLTVDLQGFDSLDWFCNSSITIQQENVSDRVSSYSTGLGLGLKVPLNPIRVVMGRFRGQSGQVIVFD